MTAVFLWMRGVGMRPMPVKRMEDVRLERDREDLIAKRILTPEEADLTLDELAARYPVEGIAER